MNHTELHQIYKALHAEAVTLAGGLTDLAQRATVYHHIYRASGGNHVFPLIAAHGALWAGGYFRFGLRLGGWLSWMSPFCQADRIARRNRLADFANALRDINRRVCVDTYTNFHFVQRCGHHPNAGDFVPAPLLAALRQVCAAQQNRRELIDVEKRAVFESHFHHEQEHIVGPAVGNAVTALDWPLVRGIALRPTIRFAYFPRGKSLRFRDFSNRAERIQNGLTAFELAAHVGWHTVERCLERYALLPAAVLTSPTDHFAALRATLLATA